jgi:hypothetical protein
VGDVCVCRERERERDHFLWAMRVDRVLHHIPTTLSYTIHYLYSMCVSFILSMAGHGNEERLALTVALAHAHLLGSCTLSRVPDSLAHVRLLRSCMDDRICLYPHLTCSYIFQYIKLKSGYCFPHSRLYIHKAIIKHIVHLRSYYADDASTMNTAVLEPDRQWLTMADNRRIMLKPRSMLFSIHNVQTCCRIFRRVRWC